MKVHGSVYSLRVSILQCMDHMIKHNISTYGMDQTLTNGTVKLKMGAKAYCIYDTLNKSYIQEYFSRKGHISSQIK